MTATRPSPIRFGQLAAGLVLAGLGTLFWLDQQRWVDAGRLSDYWPMILVVLGFGRLWDGGGRARSGAILLALGVLFQLDRLGFVRFRDTWPLVIVVAGVALAWGAFASVAVAAFSDDSRDEEDSRG